MDSGRNYKITRAILVMTAILMSVVLGSLGVSHNQNPSTENQPETVAKLSKQPAPNKGSESGEQKQDQPVSLAAFQPDTRPLVEKLVVHKSGALTQDETWTAENTYVADDTVTVPEGKTLTITEGSVVKGGQGAIIAVEQGGTLIVNGTNDRPVVVTSSKDDTVGGDTNEDSGSIGTKGDYQMAVYAHPGSNVDVKHARVAYAATAFGVNGGQVNLLDVAVDSADIGLDVSSGTVTFDGAMTNTAKGIHACSWETPDCSVRVLQSDSQTNRIAGSVCGQVTISLRLLDPLATNELFRADNCDNPALFSGQTSLVP
jgi:hypothetical protein